MALKKELLLKNGISVNYHRIITLNQMINQNIEIQLLSYLDESKRIAEKDFEDIQNRVSKGEEVTDEEMQKISEGFETYTYHSNYQIEYQDNYSVKDAYEYLKTLDKYSGAEDI